MPKHNEKVMLPKLNMDYDRMTISWTYWKTFPYFYFVAQSDL